MKYILFDLDGTITDPMQSITSSAAYALAKFGIAVEDHDTLKCFIGPPLTESFRQYYGFDKEQALEGLRFYREHYSVNGLDGNIPYEGIAELLKELKQCGKTVIIATSKPAEYAEEILRRNGLLQYFDFIGGNDLNESRPTKQQVIEYVMAHYPELSGDNAIMVGDRMYDIEGAHEFGLKCAAVQYGYGSYEELREHGADVIVRDVAELRSYLLASAQERTAMEIRIGKYRHFKGNEYRVIGVAKHSETLAPMVVYQALYGEQGYWVRPAEMWNEEIERDGKRFRRFTYIGE